MARVKGKKLAEMSAYPEAPIGLVAGQVLAKEARPDPTQEELDALTKEARRSLERLLAFCATSGQSWKINSVAKALESLRGY